MLEKVKVFLNEEQGQGMAEYGLILALVAVAVVVVLGALGTGIGDIFTQVTDQLNNAAPVDPNATPGG